MPDDDGIDYEGEEEPSAYLRQVRYPFPLGCDESRTVWSGTASLKKIFRVERILISNDSRSHNSPSHNVIACMTVGGRIIIEKLPTEQLIPEFYNYFPTILLDIDEEVRITLALPVRGVCLLLGELT